MKDNAAMALAWATCHLPGGGIMRLRAILGIYVVSAITIGCADSQPVEPRALGEPDLSVAPQESQEIKYLDIERVFAELADSVPGFAGFYYDDAGAMVIRLTDATPAHQALDRVGRLLEARGRKVERARFAPARFAFRDLAAWRDAVWRDLPEGVYSLDVDEVNNVVNIGVATDAAAGMVQALAQRLGIAADAIHIFKAPEPSFRASLSGLSRPILGGVKHEWGDDGNYCTVGVNGAWFGSIDYAG